MIKTYWSVMSIVFSLIVIIVSAVAFIFPEHTTCLIYKEPYRSSCINMDDTNKDDVHKLFYESRGFLQ